MNSFPEIIDALGDALTTGLDISKGRVAVWKHRKRIPPEFWGPVAGLKEARAKKITAEKLRQIDIDRKQRKRAA